MNTEGKRQVSEDLWVDPPKYSIGDIIYFRIYGLREKFYVHGQVFLEIEDQWHYFLSGEERNLTVTEEDIRFKGEYL